MRYLVTGADGFLGRHFLAALAKRGTPTRAMLIGSPPEAGLPGNPEWVTANLLRPESLAPAVKNVTHVVHLAARVHMMHDPAPDPDKAFHEVNVDGTVNLLLAGAQAGVQRVLLMSSVKAMGEEEIGIFDEQSPCQPQSPYGRSKREAELALFRLAQRHRLGGIVLRLPMVYGPGNKGNMLRLLQAAAKGRKLPFGRVRNQRSMVYVANVVDAALAALEHPASAGQVYLVCDKRPYSTPELYAAICKAMGKSELVRNIPVSVLKLLGLIGSAMQVVLRKEMPLDRPSIRRLVGDLCFKTDKIRNQLGFEPAVELQEGIQATVDWFLQNCPPVP